MEGRKEERKEEKKEGVKEASGQTLSGDRLSMRVSEGIPSGEHSENGYQISQLNYSDKMDFKRQATIDYELVCMLQGKYIFRNLNIVTIK